MALPAAGCTPVDDPDCAVGFQVLETFITDLVNAARDFIPPMCVDGTPVELDGYITVSSQHFVENSIALVIDGIQRQVVKLASGSDSNAAKWTLNCSLVLIEPGYPMLSGVGGEIVLPQPNEISLAAIHSLAHAERLMRTIHNLRARRTDRYCIKTIGDFEPADNDGAGWVGWVLDIDFDLHLARGD